jgi:predicted nucleic-acid-binding protein
MIGIDTNILLRFLVRDDPKQADAARRFIQQASMDKEVLFINHVVLCELAWVLKTTYRYSREDIGRAIEGILFTQQFEIEDKDTVLEGLSIYRTAKADFADCLIGVRNQAAGCSTTVTFDRGAAGSGLYRMLK